jgi:small subunit ribosomal protein SAe
MAPSQLPPVFNPTSQDIEMLLAAQCHLGSKNLQVHMEPYLWKTRPDGVNVINIGKTWYVGRIGFATRSNLVHGSLIAVCATV